jgi:hypothetical protein
MSDGQHLPLIAVELKTYQLNTHAEVGIEPSWSFKYKEEGKTRMVAHVATSSRLRGWRSTPGTTAATTHFAWLISITAIIVLSCSREVRDLLASKGCVMAALRQFAQSAKGALPSPPAP